MTIVDYMPVRFGRRSLGHGMEKLFYEGWNEGMRACMDRVGTPLD